MKYKLVTCLHGPFRHKVITETMKKFPSQQDRMNSTNKDIQPNQRDGQYVRFCFKYSERKIPNSVQQYSK